jgi:hypothetical protein
MDDIPYMSASPLQADNLPTYKRGGMFGGNGANIANIFAAAVNGYLAAGGNQAGVLGLQAMHQRQVLQQQQALEDQKYQRQLQDQRNNFVFEQQWKLDHPEPPNNDTVNDYEYIKSKLGEEAANTFLKTKTNPVVMTPYGPMPYSAVTGGGAPHAPVGKLTQIDDGGPTPPASAPFPRRY